MTVFPPLGFTPALGTTREGGGGSYRLESREHGTGKQRTWYHHGTIMEALNTRKHQEEITRIIRLFVDFSRLSWDNPTTSPESLSDDLATLLLFQPWYVIFFEIRPSEELPH